MSLRFVEQRSWILSHFNVRRLPAHVTNQRHIFLILLFLLLPLHFRVVVLSPPFLLAPSPLGRYAVGVVFLKAEDPVKSPQISGIPLDLLFSRRR